MKEHILYTLLRTSVANNHLYACIRWTPHDVYFECEIDLHIGITDNIYTSIYEMWLVVSINVGVAKRTLATFWRETLSS